MSTVSSLNLTDHFRLLRAEVESALDRFTSALGDGCPDVLREAMRYSLLAPGKRLRPMLTLMAAEACGSDQAAAIPAACAVEMIHTYSLIHDDLPAMDDDELRRGLPTCHIKFGEANAILAGDALLALAFEVLASHTQPPQVAARCCSELARAAGAEALVGGQTDDLKSEFVAAEVTQLAHLESIHRRKTGAMFLVSLRIGGIVGKASESQLDALTEYGRHLGLAFQITDDLLDVKGNEAALGKKTRKDADRGKLTFPAILGVEESSRRAEQLIERACVALNSFGTRAARLDALARYVLERNH